MKILLAGGTIHSRGSSVSGDLLIEDGKIAAVGDGRGLAGGARVVDAAGCHILPGLIDLHVHVDDMIGRFRLADTWESASRTALGAGITTLGSFITQRAGETLNDSVERGRNTAAGRSFCDYLWHLTPTSFAAEDWAALLRFQDAGWRTIKLYTTYVENGLFSSFSRLTEVAERLSPGGTRILVHAEDEGVLSRAQSSDRMPWLASDHAWMRPAEAEIRAVKGVVSVAASTGAWFHVVHVSTPEAAETIREARVKSRLTSETAPQYLFLDDSWLARPDGHLWLCTPPLRDAARAARLRELAREGAFDFYASDHCAFRAEDKDSGRGRPRGAPMGIAGIGSLPRLVFNLERDRPDRAFDEMSLRLAEHPARLAGIEGRKGALEPGLDADAAVFEIAAGDEPVVSASSGSCETYPDFQSPLRLRHLFLRGSQLVADGRWTGPDKASGRCLWTS